MKTREETINNQPKPTGECETIGGSSRMCERGTKSCEIRHEPMGEWTLKNLIETCNLTGVSSQAEIYRRIVNSHNAAVAAERIHWNATWKRESQSLYDEIEDLRKQLAAERASSKDCELCDARKSLERQLAAEREQLAEVQVFLAAEREKVQELAEALQWLRDYQNGCPLPSYEKNWNHAMKLTDDALAKVGKDLLPKT